METSNKQRLDEQQRRLDFEGTQLDWRQQQLDFERLFFHQGQQSEWEFRERQQQIEYKRLLLQGQQIVLDFGKQLEEISRKTKQTDELIKKMQESRPRIDPTSQGSAPLAADPSIQELAPLTNPKPTEIPNSTSPTIDVLGEEQTIQESGDQNFETLADEVLRDLEPELAEEEATEATELAQVEGITARPSDMSQEFDDDLEEPHTQHFKVTSNPAEIVIFDVASKEQGDLLTDSIGIKSEEVELEIISLEIFENLIAPKVFVVMSAQVESSFAAAASMVKGGAQPGNLVFDLGISVMCTGLRNSLKNYVHTDPNGSKRCQFSISNDSVGVNCEMDKDRVISREGLSDLLGYNIMKGTLLFSLKLNRGQPKLMPFDRGRDGFEAVQMIPSMKAVFDLRIIYVFRADVKSGNAHGIPSCILVFDPGGVHPLLRVVQSKGLLKCCY